MKKKGGVRRALFLSFASRYTSLAFNLVTVIVVSRVLTPAQVGVFSVAVGLTTLAQTLRTFGVSEYLVQEERLDEAIINTSFTVNLIIAWFLAAVLLAASGAVGRFYGDPGVGRVIKVLSITFFLNPFGTTAMARLQRDLAFGTLYKIRLGEVVVRSSVTIILVVAGFGYMSMAWAWLAAMVAWILGCTVWGHGYRARGLSLSQWRRVVPFGANRAGADIAIELGEQSANIVIGKMLGMADAGFYSRGYGLINMYRQKVLGAINAVAFPAFARAHRESRQAPELFRNSLVLLSGISWPFFGFSALMAAPIIRFFFGDQWSASVPVMQWLCGAGLIGTLVFQCNEFFSGVGRIKVVSSTVVRYQLARLAFAVAAAFYSIEAVAASQVLVYVLAVLLYYRRLTEYDTLSASSLSVALIPSALVAVTSCIAPAAVALWWAGHLSQHYLAALAIAVPGAAVGWLSGLMLVKHPLLNELWHVWTLFKRRLLGGQA